MPRIAIREFELANPLYKNASISFYTVASGVKTSTLATLYASTSGTARLSNPQKLNSNGRFKQPVYIDAQVVGVISGISVAGHDTGIISPVPTFRFTSAGLLQYSYDGGVTYSDAGTLAATSSASLITFTPSGSGGIATTVNANLQKTVRVTDYCACDGSDEYAKLQVAINHAVSVGKPLSVDGHVTIKTGVTGDTGLVMIGDGGSITNANTAGSGANQDINILSFNGKHNFSVRGVKFVGNAGGDAKQDGGGRGGCGIWTRACYDFSIDDNDIQDMTTCGIFCTADTGETSYGGKIRGNYLNGNGKNATRDGSFSVDIFVVAENSGVIRQFIIEGNQCLSPNIVGIGFDIYLNYTGQIYDINVNGNVCVDKQKHGIMFYGGVDDNQAGFSCIASNNVIRNCGWMGIYIVNAWLDMIIIGNKITDVCQDVDNVSLAYAGIGVMSIQGATYRCSGIVIKGNTVVGFNGWSGIRVAGAEHSVIEGNVVKGDGTSANTVVTAPVGAPYTYAHNPISLQNCSYTKVANNSVKCFDATGSECGSGAIYCGYVAGNLTYWPGNIITGNSMLYPKVGVYAKYQRLLNVSHNLIDSPPINASPIILDTVNDSIVEANIINIGVDLGVAAIRLTPALRALVTKNKIVSTQVTGIGIHVETGSDDCVVTDNDLSQMSTVLGTSGKLTVDGANCWAINNRFQGGADSNTVDTFITSNAASPNTTVTNKNVASPGKVQIWPANLAAAQLQASAAMLYVSAAVDGTSFTVTTADGSNTNGSQIFNYRIL